MAPDIDLEGVSAPDRYIDEVFGANGYLARANPKYKVRDGQIALARAIDRAIRGGHHLVGEGPTGTGKSIAYAVPAIYHSLQKKQTVVIVTANKALQAQLVNEDLPALQKALPWRFTYAILKGRSNYLCEEQLDAEPWTGARDLTLEQQDQLQTVLDWAEEVKATNGSGDVATLSLQPDHRVWEHFSVSATDCSGSSCKFVRDCYAEAAKRKAFQVNVVVANYSLLFLHLYVESTKSPESRLSEGGQGILPGFRIAVLDEGHNIVEQARQAFGLDMTIGSIRAATNRMTDYNEAYVTKQLMVRLPEGIEDLVALKTAITLAGEELFAELERMKRTGEYNVRFRPMNHVPTERLEALLEVAKMVYQCIARIAPTKERPTYEKMRNRVLRLLIRTNAFREREGGKIEEITGRMVYFLEEYRFKGKLQLKLKSSAVDVAPWLKKHLFAMEPGPPENELNSVEQLQAEFKEKLQPTVIVTSATLTVNNGFSHLIEQIGIGRPAQITVKSPFDWNKQARLIVPDDLPSPAGGTDKDWRVAAAKAFVDIINMAHGRTLGLFTSYEMVNQAHAAASRETKWRILRQGVGSLPREELVKEFRKDVNSVLIGTSSLWEGVNVPGDSLVCVVIDRLPFEGPNNPILDALYEAEIAKGASEDKARMTVFSKYNLPETILLFKQAVGRLIRDAGDRGVVVCLDNRIWTKGYGKQFLRSLPAMRTEKSLSAIPFILNSMGAMQRK